MASFIAEFGFAGYGLFWTILEVIYLAPNHKLDLPTEEIPKLCESIGTNPRSFEAVLKYLEEHWYIRREGDTIWSVLHEADVARTEAFRQKWYERTIKKLTKQLSQQALPDTA